MDILLAGEPCAALIGHERYTEHKCNSAVGVLHVWRQGAETAEVIFRTPATPVHPGTRRLLEHICSCHGGRTAGCQVNSGDYSSSELLKGLLKDGVDSVSVWTFSHN